MEEMEREIAVNEEKKEDDGTQLVFADVANILTIGGERVYKDGDIIPDNPTIKEVYDHATAEQKETLINDFVRVADEFLFDTLGLTPNSIIPNTALEEVHQIINSILEKVQPLQDLISELELLKPFLESELSKDIYGGHSLESIVKEYTPGELLELRQDPNSFYYKAVMEAYKAKENGTITTIDNRLRDISQKDFSGWLDEKPNDTAYLSYVGPHFWDDIEIDSGGNVYTGYEAKVQRAVRTQNGRIEESFKTGTFTDGRPAEHNRINKELMRALFKVASKTSTGNYAIYLPALLELNENYRIDIDEYNQKGELNEKGRKRKAEADQRAREAAEARANGDHVYLNEKPSVMQDFKNLDNWVGVLGKSRIFQTARIEGYDVENKLIFVRLPYLEHIEAERREMAEIEAERRERKYLLSGCNDLVHNNIATERDKNAVDLAYTIMTGLLRRGSFSPYRVKYRTLIEKTPLLAMAYKNAAGSKREYDVVNRTFKRAFRILRTKTDIYDYFIDLKIPEVPPTKKTLDDNLVITHKGRNPKFEIQK